MRIELENKMGYYKFLKDTNCSNVMTRPVCPLM